MTTTLPAPTLTGTDLRGAMPAVPLLLDESRAIDWRAQRAVIRYYLAAGVDGLAVGVHTTQFELHDDRAALGDLWQLVADEVAASGRRVLLVAGITGDNGVAVAETELARDKGFEAVLMCARGMASVVPEALLDRARAVGDVLPSVGFYLQESVGGRHLPAAFWRELVEIETVIGVKTAPFDRYRTRDVAEAILDSDRWDEVALLTGNDDAIIVDLVSPHRRVVNGQQRVLRFSGGLLGQYAVGARAATALTHQALELTEGGLGGDVPVDLLATGQDLVEVNGAVFDVANDFAGCVPGVNEVLRQQGLATTALCLNPAEVLSPGQVDLISRARERFGDLLDEQFIAENRDAWFS
ncbi:dihydrodipicolinate synthase family protein [Propionibacteriaceae bacterium G1746]|uniref:dihydrodipicolinate synthase family protein n=1 Tax=Aestuariimicrobium sp. G57 TaxID=3418485 RepID=UPI003C2495B2